jgi:ABC-type transporter Mla MlaB component
VVVAGRIARNDIPVLCERLRCALEGSKGDRVVCEVGGLVDPDATAVDALARLQLTALRQGCRIRLRHATPRLRELLCMTGLDAVLFQPIPRLPPVEPR